MTAARPVGRRFPTMPFTLRALETERSRFGIVECLNHSLLHPYPVLHEKASELVRYRPCDLLFCSAEPNLVICRRRPGT